LCDAEEERVELLEQEEWMAAESGEEEELSWKPTLGDGAQKDEEGGHEGIDKRLQGQYHLPRMDRQLYRCAILPH
jgi:hypothetical protein